MDIFRTTVVLSPVDKKVAVRCRKAMMKQHGNVTFTFIVREALRALEEKLVSERKA